MELDVLQYLDNDKVVEILHPKIILVLDLAFEELISRATEKITLNKD